MQTKSLIRGGLIASLLSMSLVADAYETSTHRMMSNLAVQRAQIFQDPSILRRFEFPSVDTADYQSTLPNTPARRTLIDIVGDGAEWEDDQYRFVFCNHFFDPQHGGRGLNGRYFLVGGWCWFQGRAEGNPSPLWALEDLGVARDASARNGVSDFSMRRAYASFRQALIGTTPAERSEAMSRTMQSLGHVTHHLQDMAQPQHTRNEAHLHGVGFYPGATEGPESQGAYEMYSKRYEFRIPGIVSDNVYPAIGAQTFATARHLWHTPGSANPAYVGMAEFTAHNFVGFEFTFTPLGLNPFRPTGVGPHPDFPLPNGTGADGVPRRLEWEPTTIGLKNRNLSLTGRRYYVVGNVVDGLFPNMIHRDRKLAVIGLLGQPTEDEKVFDERHRILIPRAVGFSTAYIDYFFRGRIEIAPTSVGDRWTLRNVGQFTLDGRVQLRTENAAGQRSAPANTLPISLRLLPGESAIVTFALPADARKIIAMFEGRIGNEGDLVFVDPSAADPGYHHVTGHVIDAPPLPTLVISEPTVPGVAVRLHWSGQSSQSPNGGAFRVWLSSAPRSTETVNVSWVSGVAESRAFTVSPSALVFNATNWNVPQTLTFSAPPNATNTTRIGQFMLSNSRMPATYFYVDQASGPPGCTPYSESGFNRFVVESTHQLGPRAGNVTITWTVGHYLAFDNPVDYPSAGVRWSSGGYLLFERRETKEAYTVTRTVPYNPLNGINSMRAGVGRYTSLFNSQLSISCPN